MPLFSTVIMVSVLFLGTEVYSNSLLFCHSSNRN